jgi:protein transport protein SEC24
MPPSTGTYTTPPASARPLISPWENPALLDPPAAENSIPFPRYFRTTVQAFPVSKQVAEAAAVPLGILITPSQATNVPILDYTSAPLPRCIRCYSYLSSHIQILNPTSWRCPFCGQVNADPQSTDVLSQKPELSSPVYDMLAPSTFNTPDSISPAFLFIVDLSTPAVSTGFTAQSFLSIRASVSSLPDDARIGLLTISNAITFYDFHKHTEYVASDLSDPLLPSSGLSPLSECRADFDSLVESLAAAPGISEGHCLGSALLVAPRVIGGSGGLVVACVAGLPTLGPFAVRPPDAKGVDVTLKQFRELASDLNRSNVSLSLFCQSPKGSASLRAISQPVLATGGLIRVFEEFDPAALHLSLFETITANFLRAVQVKLRCTTGIKLAYVSANVIVRDQTVMASALDANCGLGFELAIEAVELKVQSVVFQAAVLWSDAAGRRLIRIMTFALPVTNQPAVVKASVDEAAVAVYLLKHTASLVLQRPVPEAVAILNRRFAALTSGAKYSSLYHLAHGLLSAPLLRTSLADEARVMEAALARAASLVNGLLYLCPRVFVVDSGRGVCAASADAFTRGYVLLVHAWNRIYVWVNQETPRELLLGFFGDEVVPAEIPQIQTEMNQRMNEIVADCYALSGRYLPVEVIPPGDPRVSVLGELLVDSSLASGADLSGFLSSVYH